MLSNSMSPRRTRHRGKAVPDEWYQFPVFYFSNPNAIFGPGELVPHPSYTAEMDYELEVACVIGKTGMNIPVEEAEDLYLRLHDFQ